MSMVCPKCFKSYDQRLQCPTCGARLDYFGAGGALNWSFAVPRARWQEQAWGRILIGLMLSQGLFHGFRQLVTGILLVFNNEGGVQQTVTTPVGFVVVQILQMVAVLLGGLLAGSGQRHGLVLGAIVGVWNGVICACLQFGSLHGLSNAMLYGQPVVHMAIGAIGGWLGYAIWQPVQGPLEHLRHRDKARAAVRPQALFAGRVAWFRVLVGIAVAVGFSLSANLLRDLILDATAGRLSTTEFQDSVITWELKALAVLLGAFLSGISTKNGFKQGMCVGLASALILVAVEARGAARHFDVALLVVFSTLCLSLAGGWFGGQLFPPVVKYRKRAGTIGAAAMT